MAVHASTTGRGRSTLTRLTLASLAAVAALVGLVAMPSAASGDDPGLSPARPLAELELSLTRTGSETSLSTDTVKLTCSPDGGTHPDPTGACDSLRAVRGVFEKLPSTGQPCMLIYDPHTARATGRWGRTTVDYSATFSNRCFAAVGTDDVFNL